MNATAVLPNMMISFNLHDLSFNNVAIYCEPLDLTFIFKSNASLIKIIYF
jgi:hypothetical protein